MAINVREAIIDLLENTLQKNDYMSLVNVQMKIKSGYYEKFADKLLVEMNYLQQYKKSYPHISKEIDEIVEYINAIHLANALTD